jgi:hypothetical protein
MSKMNPEIKEKWLNDLKSGEYKKGKGLLRNGDKERKDFLLPWSAL